jgi:hypothetical protein
MRVSKSDQCAQEKDMILERLLVPREYLLWRNGLQSFGCVVRWRVDFGAHFIDLLYAPLTIL